MKLRLAVGVLAVGATLIGAQAAPANAFSSSHLVESNVTWNGAYCIQIESPYLTNFQTTGVNAYCGGSSRAVYRANSGDIIGANPYMGNASWIMCQVFMDGVLQYSDYATAGDGHDATCLRRIN